MSLHIYRQARWSGNPINSPKTGWTRKSFPTPFSSRACWSNGSGRTNKTRKALSSFLSLNSLVSFETINSRKSSMAFTA